MLSILLNQSNIFYFRYYVFFSLKFSFFLIVHFSSRNLSFHWFSSWCSMLIKHVSVLKSLLSPLSASLRICHFLTVFSLEIAHILLAFCTSGNSGLCHRHFEYYVVRLTTIKILPRMFLFSLTRHQSPWLGSDGNFCLDFFRWWFQHQFNFITFALLLFLLRIFHILSACEGCFSCFLWLEGWSPPWVPVVLHVVLPDVLLSDLSSEKKKRNRKIIRIIPIIST